MPLARLAPLVLLTFFLVSQSPSGPLPATGRHIASPLAAMSQAFEALRAVVLASPLARDSRPSPEEERRAYVSLWSDLETGRQAAPLPQAGLFDPETPVSDQAR